MYKVGDLEINHYTAQDAAEYYVKEFADITLGERGNIEVAVTDTTDGSVHNFTVYYETVINTYAKRV